jgi:hypothetical protein
VSARKLKTAPNKWARSKKVPEIGEEERRMPFLFRSMFKNPGKLPWQNSGNIPWRVTVKNLMAG